LQTNLDFHSQAIAHAAAQGQLAYYRLMERQGHMKMLRTAQDLSDHWSMWKQPGEATPAVGYILSMEGADPILDPSYLVDYWEQGLRAIGPAHYGQSHYAYGTGVSGPLSDRGIALLREIDQLDMLLDVTHLCDESMYQAFDLFSGPVLASHHNCRSLVPGDRQLADEQIRILIQREAVIGAALDAWMLKPEWVRGETSNAGLTLQAVADHTDHICQLAGNARHVAIGTDLDGGFGNEQTPSDVKTYADIRRLADIYRERGFTEEDIDGIFHGNWLRLFARALA
jgi:membrane dipeptidase